MKETQLDLPLTEENKKPPIDIPSCGVEFFIVDVKIKIEDKIKLKKYSIIAPNEAFVKENILMHLGGEIMNLERQPCFILQIGQLE
jgi:hypothetical protein